MKTHTLIVIVSLFVFGMGSMMGQHSHENNQGHKDGMNATETPEAFQKQLKEVVNEYLVLKDAFVASNEADAEAAATKTLAALDKVEMGLLKGDAHMEWMGQLKLIKSNLNGIVQMKGIEMKRSHFTSVSENLSAAIESFGVENEETIYLAYCPMANNREGAYWLSGEKEIRNPYFGDKMLKCGSVKKEF
ncbi:MAG: DUF3347 domain-containing protein [Chlorobi bacterium]|nr:DUF3347 domain-containing protein [Chlorobiota bacterium]